MTRAATSDPVHAAREARLRYVSDDRPGFRRRRAGRGFSYRDTHDRPIRDRETLARIKALAIPAGLARCLDLPLPERPPAGDRARRAGPQAVPLPRPLPQGS
jgi:hypothetical protein